MCMICRSLFDLLSFFLLAIMLSVLLRFTDSDYPFSIFKLLWTTMSEVEHKDQSLLRDRGQTLKEEWPIIPQVVIWRIIISNGTSSSTFYHHGKWWIHMVLVFVNNLQSKVRFWYFWFCSIVLNGGITRKYYEMRKFSNLLNPLFCALK